MTHFRMPSLGADMESGIIVEWLVEPGSTVTRGDVIVLVETEKGIIDVEIWQDATIESIDAPAGAEVAVGTVIATLQGAPASSPPRGQLSPRARAVAAELGVEPADLATKAPITEAVVRSASARADPEQKMRRAIGRAMSRSKREIPHYYVATTIDLTETLDWLRTRNATAPIEHRILPAALLFKATALAARAVPAMNGHFIDGALQRSEEVDLGIAISLRGGGLVAPAIRGCDGLTLDEVMASLTALVKRARAGHLRDAEVATATLTVTNLGERGAERGYGVIVPPQVAIVCFGRIGPRPWVADGTVVARSLVDVTLAADHRVSDGHEGGRFLQTIADHLHKPEQL